MAGSGVGMGVCLTGTKKGLISEWNSTGYVGVSTVHGADTEQEGTYRSEQCSYLSGIVHFPLFDCTGCQTETYSGGVLIHTEEHPLRLFVVAVYS